MACCCAVLLDTVSIQQYVFGSNRLRDNLGSSALVKRIYAESLEKCLDEMGYNLEVLPAWKTDYHTVLMNTDSTPFRSRFYRGWKSSLFSQLKMLPSPSLKSGRNVYWYKPLV